MGLLGKLNKNGNHYIGEVSNTFSIIMLKYRNVSNLRKKFIDKGTKMEMV
jgi:hypothetical protein